jgi:hypothetical protein
MIGSVGILATAGACFCCESVLMALRTRADRARQAQRTRLLLRSCAAVGIAVLSYAGFIAQAVGPEGNVAAPPVIQAEAMLSFAGPDLMITGSVDHIFESSAFVGPNRALKRDRIRAAGTDVLEFTRSFEAVRIHLASLRTGAPDPTERPHSVIGDPAAEISQGPRMSIAAIEPALTSDALTAIDSITGGFDGPLPLAASTQLAYARDVAPATDFAALPSATMSEKELWCLTSAIYFESRGETYRGQVAVAQVVMNRTKHRLYPGTICGVVFQNQNQRNACQFSFACDGIPETVTDRKSWAQADEIAKGVVDGTLYLAEVNNATHYHASYVYPNWAPRMTKVSKIGLHVFYRFKTGWRFG